MKVVIDKEFSQLIPHVSPEYDSELEETVLADGRFLNPFVVWKHKNILLDGYRRHKIHIKHPSLKMPAPIVLGFETRDEAHDWIIRHQLSKRNITDEQRRYLIGKLYLDQKPAKGANQHGGYATVAYPQSAKKLAEKEGVSERTVHNNAAYAEAVDAVKDIAPEVADEVLAGNIKGSTKDLEAFSELSKRDAKKAARAIADGEATSIKGAIGVVEADEPEPLEDAVGQPVPAKLSAVFVASDEFNKQSRALAVVKKWADEVSITAAGSYLHLQSFVGQLTAAQKQLKFEKPYAVCPYCLAKKAKCEACKGRGFVTKPIYDGAPSELRV